MVNVKNKMRNVLTLTIGSALLSVAFTSTAAQADEWTPAAAPITYKGSNPYATGYMPAPKQQLQAPQYQVPQYSAPQPQYRQQAALPQPMAPTPRMNMAPAPLNLSTIDRTLYKHQKVGNPYTVAGQTYYPQHDPSYDRVGTASWYGDKFHGKLTANGEIFDKNAMTAAHPTLPLNSYVYVTNLQTGQTLKVRLNDRGPFIDNRMIDLSEAAANALGLRNGGLGKVRVQYAGPSEPNGQKGAYRTQAERLAAPAPRTAPQAAPRLQAPQRNVPQIQVPAMPRQNFAQPQAQAQSQAQRYSPLRQQAQPPAQVAQLPQVPMALPTAPQITAPRSMNSDPTMLGLELPQAPIAIPQAANPSNEDGSVVTLTIKGPIHMAGDRNGYPSAQLTKAVNRVTYKTN